MNEYKLTEYCNELAAEIVRDISRNIASGADSIDGCLDRVSEVADGSEHVIYHYKAHKLCLECNTDQGEDFLNDCWDRFDHGKSYDEMASLIAYGEIHSRIQSAIHEIFQAMADAE